jgi:hypothetical protein
MVVAVIVVMAVTVRVVRLAMTMGFDRIAPFLGRGGFSAAPF